MTLIGAEETLATQTIKIDKTAPSLTKELSGTLGTNGWYTSNVGVTLTDSDAISGVASVEYNLNNAADWVTYSGPFTISTEGSNTLQHRVTDNAGRQYVLPQQTIKIDKTAPVITVNFNDYGVYPLGSVLTFGASDSGGSLHLSRAGLFNRFVWNNSNK